MNIPKNIDERFEYADMYNWTNDIPENTLSNFLDVIRYINQKEKEINILEIGTFTGTSAIKLVELIKNSRITVIDTWQNYNETFAPPNTTSYIIENNIEKIFYNNIEKSGLQNLFTVKKGDSFDMLIEMIREDVKFDLIYVDGNHTLLQSYLDIKLSFELLKKGGILVIDDTIYNIDNILESPFQGVNNFIKTHFDKIKIICTDYRVFLEKK